MLPSFTLKGYKSIYNHKIKLEKVFKKKTWMQFLFFKTEFHTYILKNKLKHDNSLCLHLYSHSVIVMHK